MTKSEIKEIIGQFGEINLNGSKYKKTIHATIRKLEGEKVTLRRPSGQPLEIKAKDLIDFIPQNFNQRRCPVCQNGTIKVRKIKTRGCVKIGKCDNCGYEPVTDKEMREVYFVD